jgi:hypothetical protein
MNIALTLFASLNRSAVCYGPIVLYLGLSRPANLPRLELEYAVGTWEAEALITLGQGSVVENRWNLKGAQGSSGRQKTPNWCARSNLARKMQVVLRPAPRLRQLL